MTRLKQILFGKEDVIRKVSIAYEQAKNNVETYIDEIEYLRIQVQEAENKGNNQIVVQNENLKAQNRQLLMMLMNNLTKINRRSSEKRKNKKNKFGGTLMTSTEIKKPSFLDSSQKSRSKHRIKTLKRKHSSKRRSKKPKQGRARALTSDRYFNSSQYPSNPHNLSSLTPLNKNLINIQNNILSNNYQSFDSTLDK